MAALFGGVFDVGDGGQGLVGGEVLDDHGGVFAYLADHVEEGIQVEKARARGCFGDMDDEPFVC